MQAEISLGTAPFQVYRQRQPSVAKFVVFMSAESPLSPAPVKPVYPERRAHDAVEQVERRHPCGMPAPGVRAVGAELRAAGAPEARAPAGRGAGATVRPRAPALPAGETRSGRLKQTGSCARFRCRYSRARISWKTDDTGKLDKQVLQCNLILKGA